jgi:hypothetical protein
LLKRGRTPDGKVGAIIVMDAAICLFAWDLADEGIDSVLEYVADAGINTLFLSSVYHAGWFVLPHNPAQAARRSHCTK